WLGERIESLSVTGHWQAVARATLRDNVYDLQRILCLQVLKGPSRGTVDAVLGGWAARRKSAVEAVRSTMNDMRSLPEMDFATLSVAVQAIRRLADLEEARSGDALCMETAGTDQLRTCRKRRRLV